MNLLKILAWMMGMTLALPAQASSSAYVSDVQAEREEHFYEIFLFAEPAVKEKPLSDVIFNVELSKEFRNRYRDKFGTIDTESIAYQRTDYDRLDLFRSSPTIVLRSSDRRVFADYMLKRLAEWHVDHYIKSEPAMRPIYEVKERLKKVEVRVTKETKLEARYSLAGNIFDLLLENPYADGKLTLEMDSGTFGPAPVQESTLLISKPLTSSLRAENTWTGAEGRGQLLFIKSHTSNFSTSYGLSAAYKAGGQTPRDSRLISGLGYSF